MGKPSQVSKRPKKYAKIDNDQKWKLFISIKFCHMSIRKAALKMNITYTTAKRIYGQLKKKWALQEERQQRMTLHLGQATVKMEEVSPELLQQASSPVLLADPQEARSDHDALGDIWWWGWVFYPSFYNWDQYY